MSKKNIDFVSWKIAPSLNNIRANDKYFVKCVKCDEILPVWNCSNCGHSSFSANEPSRYNDGSCFVKCKKCESEWGHWNHIDCGARNKYSVSLLYGYDSKRYNEIESENWRIYYKKEAINSSVKLWVILLGMVGGAFGYVVFDLLGSKGLFLHILVGVSIGAVAGAVTGLQRGKKNGRRTYEKKKRFYRPTRSWDFRKLR